MVGQGRPGRVRSRFALGIGVLIQLSTWIGLAMPAALIAQEHAAEPTMLVRVGWGGGAERQWRGRITIDKGSLAVVRPLGVVADSPGSIWAASDNQIEIRERSPRSYDGVDVEITAPLDARLTISLAPDAEPRPATSEVLLSDLAAKMHRINLDARNNQLLVRRGPGDMLRVATDHEPLIFTPGEVWKLDIKPRLLPVAAGSTVYLRSRLLAARTGAELWSQDSTIKATATDADPSRLSLEVKLPDAEGVYDLAIEASERGPLRRSKPVVERRVQVIVLAPQSPLPPGDSAAWTELLEIDPTSPHWYDRFKSLRLSALIATPLGKDSGPVWQGPLGNGNSQIVQHPLGRIVQLAPASNGSDASWEAYPLAIAKPGTPHLLEIDYPSDVPQTLGISIIEPDAAGAVSPIELDSGVDVPESATTAPPTWLKHRLLFWPRTASPVVLLCNRRDGTRAAYGKLRLYSGPQRLRRAYAADDRVERMLAGYLDRPLFTANFSASESLDPYIRRSLTDWQTFYEGGTRLADYLSSTGRNALMMAVFAEGSTIYPSRLAEPTTRFDTGAFFDLGQDPARKDVLEMLLRIFDREQLKFIPLLQFSTPLPELEAAIRNGGPNTIGLQPIGRDGSAWTDVNEPRWGAAPYYNVLDPLVQEAMLNVIRELLQRYGRHPSFAGLGLGLSADGFAQLPGEAWGLDDRTIGRFQQEARVVVPGSGAGRFAQRADFVLGPGRRAWLTWRSGVLADFHRRIQRELSAVRPDARLYIASTNVLDSSELSRELRPGLPSRARIEEALLAIGIQPELYRAEQGIVLLRQQRVSPAGSLAAQAIDIEANRSSDWDGAIHEQMSPGSLFFDVPEHARLASFDAKSPFGKDKTYTWLSSQISPSQQENRRRFVHSLATLDSQAMFDGGWMLPLGQESALDNLIAAYRHLPAARFQTVADSMEPVTVRMLRRDGRTIAYAVNDSPWSGRIAMRVESPSSQSGTRPQEFGGLHRIDVKGPILTIDVDPYDLVVVEFPTADLTLASPQFLTGNDVQTGLAATIRDLHNRRAALDSPPPLAALANPDFELPARGGQIPGWSWTAGPQDQVNLDTAAPHHGQQSLHVQSGGGIVSVRSEPFAAPPTGRLTVSVWLKTSSAAGQPPLRLILESAAGMRPFYKFAPLGGAPGAKPIPSQWQQFIYDVGELPADVPPQLVFRVDLLAAGEVWLDDVQLFHLYFSDAEKIQLSKIIARADFQLNSGRFGDCLYELEGFWPRLLNDYVPLPGGPLVSNPANAPAPAPKDPADKSASRPILNRIKDAWKF
jgi:hypothetical protein